MTELMEEVVNVAGILIPRVGKCNKKFENTPSFLYENGSIPYLNLQQLTLAVSCFHPVLLQGPVGSGKTSTVEYLAHLTGHKLPNSDKDVTDSPLFLKIQLGEQTDARMLLGGYQCTEIPGHFVWKPGVLTQAVTKGYWLLLEDIDCTSSDVITVIDNLVKTQSLCVPGYSDNIIPHPQFQLFATQRTLGHEANSGVKSNVLKHWITIQLNSLSKSDVVYIINQKYPKLTSIASRIVSVLDLDYTQGQANVRIASIRDILKWCNRCHDYFKDGDPGSALRIFHDAVDIFCGFMERESRVTAAEQIGFKLGIVKNKANFLSSAYKPSVRVTKEKFIAGRACLERRETESLVLSNKVKKNVFSLTTQACCLLEKISCCLECNEPVLLVGETGCGKTTVLQFIANTLGKTLIVINMNQQSDTADLIGGFKPVTFKWIMKPLCEKFELLFRNLFDPEKNADCLIKFSKLVKKQNWDVLMNFIIHVQKRALGHIKKKLNLSKGEKVNDCENLSRWEDRLQDWLDLGTMIEKYSKQRQAAEKSLVFSFIEGSLVTAMKQGHWVLLDEINLASSETLDCLSGLLEDARGSISLLEKGDSKPVYRDPGFRLFAAMNPATDVGKKQLPIGLRNRFTELFIDELENENDLLPLVETYLQDLCLAPNKLLKIVKFYLKVKKDSKSVLLDGNGRKPHYSLRNLCRALTITAKNPCGSTPRSLYEALSVSFLTQLDNKSYGIVHDLIVKTVTDSDIKSLLNQPIPKPSENGYINIEGFWLPVGTLKPNTPDNYILTPTVQRHFRDLIKIVSLASGIPVLLEGDTSVGKTSLINYLAKRTGNVCSRVNNHEHTDIQEYIGTYVADAQGKLVFKEGILCESMRKGHWLILDELNLAPTEVLEALNRVLDDNRELFIPETQVTIKAHEKFLLFATQNPPGLYGGRKELSRAFRNRFIELQFNQIPPDELVTILQKRCQMPLTYCKKMVSTMTDLQLRRRGSDIFIGKSGFITLRDLFRWGERYQKAEIKEKFHDWDQHLADEGYILLGGRVRLDSEAKVIEEVISKYFKRKTNPDNLFSLHDNTSDVTKDILEKLMHHSEVDQDFKHIVWTYSMRRLAVLVCKALDFSEPVLIVGETGCGKTSVVQLLARLRQQQLYSVNCHMHSESADFLGGLRPVRNESRSSGKLFEWCDGPLIQAMSTGSFFLADEISLADDSVLERLNSLLEPERTILLAEKGGGLIEDENEDFVTVADENFKFIGTMNPGGDYGKKELSPALRNRFTEIWVDTTLNKFECYCQIIQHNLKLSQDLSTKVSVIMTKFLKWFKDAEMGSKIVMSVRDVLTWVNFMNSSGLEWFESCVHGVCLTFLDGLGSGSCFGNDFSFIKNFKRQCIDFLVNEIIQLKPEIGNQEFLRSVFENVGEFSVGPKKVGIHPFYIEKGKWNLEKDRFVFNAPTTFANAKRLLRGLKTNKAILLEGSPGVGKTSLVSSLAKASGYKLARINLSDQTDISDLFGADLPDEGGTAGYFSWKDGPFLTALKEGQWILLDELNLASQSVLEGLNAVLDHRGSVYIPELNKTFYVSTETRLFGCQNPLKEGGNRRGLPKSFLNRFTQVYVEPLTEHDYVIILNETFPNLSRVKIKGELIINLMIKFNAQICKEIAEGRVGIVGGPWELNLRDMTRWAEGIVKDLSLDQTPSHSKPEENVLHVVHKYMNLLYLSRFRSSKDRVRVYEIYVSYFGDCDHFHRKTQIYLTKDMLFLGNNLTKANKSYFFGDLNEFEIIARFGGKSCTENSGAKMEILKLCASYRGKRKLGELRLLEKQYPILSSLCQCVDMNWLTILVGETGTGKTSSIKTFAALKGQNLKIMSCNSAMDTTEILGGFEQTDYNRHLDTISENARILVLSAARRYFENGKEDTCLSLLKVWKEYKDLPINDDSLSATASFNAFLTRLDSLLKLLRRKDLRVDHDLNALGQDLTEQLKKLKKNLSSSDCLTFGGKFEWVDSLLVKSLTDGSWLLLEDVNLCSNAVLDRLNCLLEPNGSLTIGERGAVADGKLVTIKPHPDFRLFFTLDPKNGTISRAMRNRGVEIYLSAEGEITEWPQLDLLSLLKDSGVEDIDTQKALMELESKCERQNISTLTSNGFWSAQYVRHGFARPEAFRKSSKLVYKFMDSKLIDEVSLRLNSDRAFNISLMRPPLENLLIDPGSGRLKQSLSLLNLLSEISKAQEVPSEMFSHVFGCKNPLETLNVGSLMTYNASHIYLTTSIQCARSLGDFLPRYVEDSKDLKVKNVLVELLNRFGNALPRCDSEDLPWDTRWFENVQRFHPQLPSEEANKILTLMKYSLNLFFEDSIIDSKEMTVAKYSNLVTDGRLEDSLSDEPIASNFITFLNDFDRLTEDTLKCSAFKMSEAEANWFLGVMKWRFRLGQQGKLILLSSGKKKTLNEDTLTLLDLHLSWFLKFIVKIVNEKFLTRLGTLPETLRRKYSEFWALSEKIVSSKNSSKLIKISNIFRKCLGHPSPDKYLRSLEEGINGMEIVDPSVPDFQGDPCILRSIFNRLVEYIHLEISSSLTEGRSWDAAYTKQFLSLLYKLDKQMKHAPQFRKVVEQFNNSSSKDRLKLTSEIMFLSLKTLNSGYDFAEEITETSENTYLEQILPFHRAVWTARILRIVFDSERLWKLSSFRKSQDELCDLICSVLPNAAFPMHKVSRAPLLDSRLNDLSRLSLEINKIIKTVKLCLKIETDSRGITEVLTELSEKSNSGLEKGFYKKLNTIVRTLVSLNLSHESGLEVVGCFWTLLGLLEMLILREGKVDSIRKKLIKADYAKAEVVELETELLALELYSTITGISLNHFYSKNLKEEVKKSRQNLEKYSLLENVRRDPETFRELSKEIESFMVTFDEGFQFWGSAIDRAFKQGDADFADHFYRKLRFIHLKNKQFSAVMEDKFVTHFPDVTYPILAASSQIEHGINIIMSELLCRPFAELREVEASVLEFCRFPIPPKVHFVSGFQKLNVAAWPKDALKKVEDHKLLVLFSSCLVKYNEWLFFKDEYSYDELMSVFSKVVEFWKKEEEKRKLEEMEKESLYVRKGAEKCKTISEDEEFLEEQLQLFPTFEEDFDEEKAGKNPKPNNKMGVFNHEQLSQVSRMHIRIVKEHIRTGWYPKSNLNLSPDFVSPVRMRFALLSRVLPHVSYLLNEKIDENLLPGLLVLMNCKESGSCSMEANLLVNDNKIYDFYRDKNVEEVSKCLEILQGLNQRVKELLNEWPDHPALNQIKVVIERIFTFSIDSPVMRFLTGLELVLQSCQHWESVAHSGVSLAEFLISITNLIIQWRKLELLGWKNCLQAAHERMKADAFKWWFHFWCLVEEFLTEEGESSKFEELVKALYNFIESSPMGEFDTRLEILLAYHYHVLRLPESKKRHMLSVAFWNLFAFYQQFSKEMGQKLSSEAAPIFKKLKEYVSIAKWHDITYWSVKQAIEKSHRTLVKFIKEYEVVLKKKVELNTFNPAQRDVGKKKKKKISPNIDITKYLKNSTQAVMEKGFPIQNLERKLEKARKFSNDIVLTAEYPNLVLNVEETTESICESAQHFAELDVDRSLPEEKRKAQAKSIVHQKRRALADLFKTMQRIGLSYRAGLSDSSFDILNLCKGPPMGTLNCERLFDPSGEEYYLKSIFRKQVLDNSLLTPSKEIGPPVIERLKGFSNHLMDLNRQQKLTLCEATVALEKCLEYESALTNLVQTDEAIPRQVRFSQKVHKFKDAISETCYLLQQFSHVLESWPLAGSAKLKEMNYLSGDLTPPILTAVKSDDIYTVTRKQFDDIRKGFSSLNLMVEENLLPKAGCTVKINNGVCAIENHSFSFYTCKHMKLFEECVGKFSQLVKSLKDFLLIFNNESVSSQLTSCLSHLGNVRFSFEDCKMPEREQCNSDFEQILKQDVSMLIENVLLGIQRLIKKYKGDEEVKGENGTSNADDFGELLEGHLEKKLVASLNSDLKDLNVEEVNSMLQLIFQRLTDFSESDDAYWASPCLRILSTAVPFVKQYSLLFSYFVTQQSLCYRASNKLASVLLGTFIQVAQKGYCAPPEFEEDGDGEGWSEKEGGGFTGGEGEGQKDVSDRIESEDQLEDARPQGSEKDKEQERDCKEEENGIEMSENFEGKSQDLDEKNEDDNENDEDKEEEEVDDDEMGETEPGADKLEKEMWSDSEEEEEEGNPDKKEEKGRGEEINKDKYAAKDDNDEAGPDEEGENDKQRKEKQKEINEMEEPEDNGDQVDPYHGHHEPEIEPEPLDLPEDLQLDDGDMKGDDDKNEENPFDIDAMKEQQPPIEPEEEKMDEDKPEEKTNEEESDSDGEEAKTAEQNNEEMDVDENENEEENGEGKKDNSDDKKKEDEDKLPEESVEEFHPSDDRPSELPAQPAPETKENEMSSADQVVATDESKQKDKEAQETSQKTEKEPKGVGQAEMEQTKQSHEANTSKKEKLQSGQSMREREKKRERPGKSDEDRCLGDAESQVNKKLKTLDKIEEKKEEKEGGEGEESDLYQHVSEKIEEATQVLDAATKEQAENQALPNKDEEEGEKPSEEDDVAMDVDEEDVEMEEVDKRKPSELETKKSSNKNAENDGDVLTDEIKKQIEGELVKTMNVERGPETTFHTHLPALGQEPSLPLHPEEVQALRLKIQEQLSTFNSCEMTASKSVQAWQLLTSVVDGLARDLSEQLRLILEPTQATRLKGDYRTGRRINMRKVISYIASEFRKDSIWLRRTKPWKRDHEIVLAIDDSSSMSHNESKELAFESLALVFKALSLIEAGQLGVLSFGEKTKIVHRPGDPFTDDTGARILQAFTFEQNKTLVCDMLDVSTCMMSKEKKKEDVARLLMIISDGRGVFSEGIERVKTAVRRATDFGIFVVFVIIDNPKSKDSIMDIRMPEFKDGKFLGIKSYMELFPFPYYVILRDIAALPNTLSDALRQWFQLITAGKAT